MADQLPAIGRTSTAKCSLPVGSGRVGFNCCPPPLPSPAIPLPVSHPWPPASGLPNKCFKLYRVKILSSQIRREAMRKGRRGTRTENRRRRIEASNLEKHAGRHIKSFAQFLEWALLGHVSYVKTSETMAFRAKIGTRFFWRSLSRIHHVWTRSCSFPGVVSRQTPTFLTNWSFAFNLYILSYFLVFSVPPVCILKNSLQERANLDHRGLVSLSTWIYRTDVHYAAVRGIGMADDLQA